MDVGMETSWTWEWKSRGSELETDEKFTLELPRASDGRVPNTLLAVDMSEGCETLIKAHSRPSSHDI